ncbi:hypothetical protein HJG54_22935 [Leptolyngbya sp. NK1-12]|uniref:Uncharacterized protein n=1 Tax=Leptolyngbya sp. NK1-12 TaxID=2547451 RepID=A0AA97AHG1_9CYAN|nr:hypothetical protein [Leptolyngbya sp. NK1-12]WNZ25425.1 hypothetical protein HJG54_22935 [Leptolyngbya sp. NK1-12]
MERTRLSLFYLVGYLIPSGIMLLIAPRFALKLLLSNGDYGDVFPRAAGMLAVGLGIMLVQMLRLRLSDLYSTTLIVRSFFFVCLLSLYNLNYDPFFLVLLVILSIGIVLTTTSYILDKQDASKSNQES